jgi:putative acetyltransferase
MLIREALPSDADQIITVLKHSVYTVCGALYKDKAVLDRWCSNRTIENITEWMNDPKNYMVVLQLKTEIHGVALGRIEGPKGKILLCYLLPESLGKGFGEKLLVELEEWLMAHQAQSVNLESTLNAANFYLGHGYKVTRVKLDDPVSLDMQRELV